MFLEKLINNTLNSLSGVQEKIKDNQNLYEKLEEVLKSISIENLKVEDYEKARDNLKSIYENGFFRHKYSRITSYLINISQENPKAIEIVINNLEQISNKEKENSENTAWQKSLDKLIDHINLEEIRLKNLFEIKQSIKEFRGFENKFKDFENKFKDFEVETKALKRDYIAILGIFASIILAFVAGLTFSSSVLSNIDKANIYKLSFVMCMIGLFITNILYFLFSFIKDLTYKENKKNFFKKHISILFFNFFIFLGLLFICFLYFYSNCITVNYTNSLEQNQTIASKIKIEKD
ncbi:hypothetical protein [Campylobacter ureolyticus]|uniref:hypothetical protein n=1 Tax=Campylobacter ureolyticus TaxID=827 RepID=UPI0022B494B6|nr:hypothetical protein [Campylobacter ureolyticus]MCZ6116924.1 hypothetical protein [Campylobacter ureolyticus]MDU4981105.1 hypothetical protein [Campylobacter ureolyticus]